MLFFFVKILQYKQVRESLVFCSCIDSSINIGYTIISHFANYKLMARLFYG